MEFIYMSINYKKPYKEQFAKVLGPHGFQYIKGTYAFARLVSGEALQVVFVQKWRGIDDLLLRSHLTNVYRSRVFDEGILQVPTMDIEDYVLHALGYYEKFFYEFNKDNVGEVMLRAANDVVTHILPDLDTVTDLDTYVALAKKYGRINIIDDDLLLVKARNQDDYMAFCAASIRGYQSSPSSEEILDEYIRMVKESAQKLVAERDAILGDPVRLAAAETELERRRTANLAVLKSWGFDVGGGAVQGGVACPQGVGGADGGGIQAAQPGPVAGQPTADAGQPPAYEADGPDEELPPAYLCISRSLSAEDVLAAYASQGLVPADDIDDAEVVLRLSAARRGAWMVIQGIEAPNIRQVVAFAEAASALFNAEVLYAQAATEDLSIICRKRPGAAPELYCSEHGMDVDVLCGAPYANTPISNLAFLLEGPEDLPTLERVWEAPYEFGDKYAFASDQLHDALALLGLSAGPEDDDGQLLLLKRG